MPAMLRALIKSANRRFRCAFWSGQEERFGAFWVGTECEYGGFTRPLSKVSSPTPAIKAQGFLGSAFSMFRLWTFQRSPLKEMVKPRPALSGWGGINLETQRTSQELNYIKHK